MVSSKNSLALRVSDLNKTNKSHDFSLKNINIEVPYGSIVGNIGKNGAGKSTTISCILGMFQKDEGTVEIFGSEYSNQIDIKKHIGVVVNVNIKMYKKWKIKMYNLGSTIHQLSYHQ